MEKDLMERYLYDVVRRLPQKQREDIEKELRSLMEDMVEAKMEESGRGREECMKEVLGELGDPAKMARSYRGENDCLIGGEYYDNYCFVLKVVLLCAGVGILISSFVSAGVQMVEAQMPMNEIWMENMASIGNIPMILVQIFGIITLIYAILERNHVKVTSGNDTPWNLEKLPQIPYKKAVISRGDSAVELVFNVIIFIMFLLVPQLMGAWIQADGNIVSVPLFNLSIWGQVLPLFLICIVAGFVDALVKLVMGRYCYPVMIVNLAMNTVNFIISFVIFKMFPIWNTDFVPALERATGKTIEAKYDILTYFNTEAFTNGFLLFILACCLLDSGIIIYRTFRYGDKHQ